MQTKVGDVAVSKPKEFNYCILCIFVKYKDLGSLQPKLLIELTGNYISK